VVKVKGDSCDGCGTVYKKKSKSAYCAKCFHANVDNIKSEYNAARWKDGSAKMSHWRHRGVKLHEADVEKFNNETHCGICSVEFSGNKCLDHCHETGVYRGALCMSCNTSLGKLGDDLDLVISRLKTYRKQGRQSKVVRETK